MKKLQLVITKNEEKRAKYKYSIFFQRGNVLRFTSKRKAEDYLRLFTSNVNDLIRSSFTIHKKFYDLYLNHYFEIDVFKCNVIQNKNSVFLQRLEYCFKGYSLGNESIAVNSVWSLLNSVEDSVVEFKEWAKVSNKYNLVNECNSLLQMHSFLNDRYFDMIQETKASKEYKTKTLQIAYKSPMLMTS
jgi:hypothetical protein